MSSEAFPKSSQSPPCVDRLILSMYSSGEASRVNGGWPQVMLPSMDYPESLLESGKCLVI